MYEKSSFVSCILRYIYFIYYNYVQKEDIEIKRMSIVGESVKRREREKEKMKMNE